LDAALEFILRQIVIDSLGFSSEMFAVATRGEKGPSNSTLIHYAWPSEDLRLGFAFVSETLSFS
jgi:hypothetical protein